MKNIIFTVFLLIAFIPEIYGADNCKKNRALFLQKNESLYAEYVSLGFTEGVSKEKKGFWLEGNPQVNKALFLAHGFMGSPGEMMYLAQPFINEGWTVVGFLIPGHGASYQVANAYKNSRWIKEIKNQLELVTSCFSEVRAVGFSTGGLLLHHYALFQKIPSSLKSLHLISPYFIQRFGGFFDRLVGYFVNGISVDTAYSISHFRDLKVMTIDRPFYHHNIPIDSGLQVKNLGLSVYETKALPKIKIPVQLFLTEGDWTVDVEASAKVIKRDYERPTIFFYKGEEPHHLMSPSVSQVALEIQQAIFSNKKSE